MEHTEATTHFIGDIANRLRISQRTIRYYEERGLIKPSRSSGGFRVYEEGEVERLETILLMKELGMSLEEISSLIKLRHEGAPSEVTPKLRQTLLKHLINFKRMVDKYNKGIAQLEAVIKLLKVCAACGHRVEKGECSHCLSKREEDVPPLMKTLVQ
jgi:DNA-binding transcriptional MerR regulator